MTKCAIGGVSGVGGTTVTDAEAIFFAAVQTAEGVRQVAMAAASTQAAVKAADLTFHRAVAAAAAVAGSAGVSASHLGGPSRNALRELGTGGT